MTITLINAAWRMKILNLPYETYCAARGSCACVSGNGAGWPRRSR